MNTGERLKAWAKRVKRDGLTLWFAGKHPRTPWHAKAVGVFVVAYALSPIDLIPDFIPVLGYVDDVLLLPGLIYLAIRLLPPDVLVECRGQAEARMDSAGAKPRSKAGAVVIVALWLSVGAAAWFFGSCHGLESIGERRMRQVQARDLAGNPSSALYIIHIIRNSAQ